MNVWVEATRPRTLPASLAPVVVGTAAAERFIPWRALSALIVSLSLQIAVIFANDLSDARRGVDTDARVGPRRAVASGLIGERAMAIGIGVALVVACLSGTLLAAAAGWELLWVGLAAMVAALAYSGGPRPYASAGLGEVMVFLFFGLVATVGSAYVQDEQIRLLAVTAAIPMGALAAAILLVNNLRDIPTDRAAGKITLAVRLGAARTVALYRAFIGLAFLMPIVIAAVDGSAWPLLAFFVIPLALRTIPVVSPTAEAPALIGALGATARTQLAFAVLLAVGLWISS
jgi:1,4-dihydroxy-2-naphthoate octaprenyltransferase